MGWSCERESIEKKKTKDPQNIFLKIKISGTVLKLSNVKSMNGMPVECVVNQDIWFYYIIKS